MRVEGQGELGLAREPLKPAIPIELVLAQRSASAAFCLACQTSGLDDKEIYLAIGIDSGTFSRIKKGEANFPLDKLNAFCAVVGNRLFADWIAAQVDCLLVLMRSEAERRAEEAEKALREERQTVKLLKEILAGRAA